MKIVISAVAILVAFVMISAQSAYAQLGAPHSKYPQAAYNSGFKYGVHDARVTCKPDCSHVYIFQPGKTFYFHTGFCSAGGPDIGGMDENEASFDCVKTIKDPESADWYVCGGQPEMHGKEYRDCPAPSSGVKGNENNSN
jgi:hypothetical protein